MMERPLRCVVDASVAIKLLVDEPLSGEADAFFEHLAADREARFFVPDLFYAECANVLWKYVQRFGYGKDEAEESMATLLALALSPLPLAAVTASALSFAVTHGITVYDACYVAAARLVGVPLITADQRLAGRLESLGELVHVLGQFEVPPCATD